MKRTLLTIGLVLTLCGCASVIDKARQVANVGFSTVTNAVGVVDTLNPFIPDPVNTNKVIPNPAFVQTTTSVGGMFGPWGLVGAAVVGAGLTIGANIINQKRNK